MISYYKNEKTHRICVMNTIFTPPKISHEKQTKNVALEGWKRKKE